MSGEPIDLSIVIVSYKVRERLRSCLDSLRLSDPGGPRFEVIVVDNASGDGTVEALGENYPEVVSLPMDRNLGFSIACNRGASRARGKWILFLNPDTIVYPETFAKICRFAEEHPDAGIVGCRILDGEGHLQLACRRSIPTVGVALSRLSGLSLLFPRSRTFGRYNLTYLDPACSYPVEAVSGSFLFITREAYKMVGGFDEDYFLYAEDLDLCLKVAKAGKEIWYCGETSIVHHKGQSAAMRPWGARMDFYRAMVVFSRKNLGVGPFLEVFLNFAAALLATGNVLANQFRDFKRLLLDVFVVGSVFMAVAMTWLGIKGIQGYVSSILAWIWLAVLIVCIFAGQASIGAYRNGRIDTKRRILAMVVSLGAFLGIGLMFKQWVVSRAVFAVGGGLAGLSLVILHMLPYSSSNAPMRLAVVGTGEHSLRLARILRNQGRVRVVGFLALSDEPSTVDGDLMVVARAPHVGPVAKALEIQGVVLPGDDPDVAKMLVQVAGTHRHGLKLFLSLMPAGTEVPALVDITLDKSLIPERSA